MMPISLFFVGILILPHGASALSLQKEIDQQRKLVKADGYPMSIGELANMYRDSDLDIHPAFQRFFRWGSEQKSRWIESLLLGIPTPSIFVAQRQDGVWDVVDGLQRLSTIFEFMGILRDEKGQLLPPLSLQGTRYLPSLEGTSWETAPYALTEDQRRFLKREKLDVKIVKRESDEAGKYELFQRLNTGGSALSDQELRNCMLVSIDSSFFDWINKLATSPPFIETVPLPDRLLQERFDLELVLRFILFRNIDLNEFKGIRSINEFITDKMLETVSNKSFDRKGEETTFNTVFTKIAEAMGDGAFCKYNFTKNHFSGAFLVSAFEIIAMGMGNSTPKRKKFSSPADLRDFVVGKIWQSTDAVVSKSGESAVARLPRTLKLGRELFKA
jgi:hypothetical protein